MISPQNNVKYDVKSGSIKTRIFTDNTGHIHSLPLSHCVSAEVVASEVDSYPLVFGCNSKLSSCSSSSVETFPLFFFGGPIQGCLFPFLACNF